MVIGGVGGGPSLLAMLPGCQMCESAPQSLHRMKEQKEIPEKKKVRTVKKMIDLDLYVYS